MRPSDFQGYPLGIIAICIAIALIMAWPSVREFAKDVWRLIRLPAFRRRRIAGLEVTDLLTKAASKINSDYPSLVPARVAVKWAHGSPPGAMVEDGLATITLSAGGGLDEHLAAAALEFTRAGLLRDARPYVDKTVMDGICLLIARKLVAEHLQAQRPPLARAAWIGPREMPPELESVLADLSALDDAGLLFPVFLRELACLPGCAAGLLPPAPQIREDTRLFLDFAAKIATRQPGRRVPLDYAGELISAGFVLIGDTGTGPYLHRLSQKLETGARRVYLLARGEYVPNARDVRLKAVTLGLAECAAEHALECRRPDGSIVRGICIELVRKG